MLLSCLSPSEWTDADQFDWKPSAWVLLETDITVSADVSRRGLLRYNFYILEHRTLWIHFHDTHVTSVCTIHVNINWVDRITITKTSLMEDWACLSCSWRRSGHNVDIDCHGRLIGCHSNCVCKQLQRERGDSLGFCWLCRQSSSLLSVFNFPR